MRSTTQTRDLRYMGTLVLLTLALAAPARAQQDESIEERPDLTPRSALRSFMAAVRAGARAEAVAYLALGPSTHPDDAWQAARRLDAVIESHIADDGASLSDQPVGRTDDHLPDGTDDIARVSAGGRGSQPVRMVREPDGRWHFSATTTARINDWYGRLPDRWLRDRLPPALMLPGPRGLFWWQVMALPLLAALAWLLGRGTAAVMRKVLERLTAKTETDFDDLLVERLTGPLTLFSATLGARLLLSGLLLTENGQAFLQGILSALAFVSLYWALMRSIELSAAFARTLPVMDQKPQMRALLPLAIRTAKVVLTTVALVVVLQKLGYPAASLIAGLGIGGLAFALAAQKTVENLFGSVMLSLDQPFRPGDAIQVEGLTGTVETVGLRSTRVRTPDRTMVTIPNGRLADLRIESLAARDQMRLLVTLGLTYGTRAGQLEAIVGQIRALLDEHPGRQPETSARVLLTNFGQNALEVEVLGFFVVQELSAFMALRHELLLEIMSIIERNGAALAFPTRTVHLTSPPQSGSTLLPATADAKR